ncbi:MAG: hypothetical protein SD837_22085 [Candidatus Electrothrix scaldis]|nr:MAG: hypothetical protein SD837_22085 [Candidatus Electrothrix sp. GW3-3]
MPIDPDNPDLYDPDEGFSVNFDPEDDFDSGEFPEDERLDQEHFALFGDRAERAKLQRDIDHYESLDRDFSDDFS